jgi:tetratricopeptide (TPR) repeat protein/2-polyprenyl-3-methyl-5-hydroxy-6-metoxy-1,4-benzoquinol methylase
LELTLNQALKKGTEAHKAGKVQEADRYYTAILKANPKHPDANHNMGVLAVGLSKVEEALPFFKTALETNPSIAQYWLSYINALIKLDRMADAKAVFDQAKNTRAKGDAFDQIELQLQSSSVKFKNQTREDIPTQPNILDELKLDKALKLANKKVKDGLREDAKKIYEDILKKFPKNKKALDGIKTLASKALANTSEIGEPPGDQLQSLVNLYSQGQYQQALNKGSQLLEQFPNSINLYNILGVVNQSLGKLDEAIEAYKKALSINPDYADAYLNMGNALKDLGKLEEAIEAYSKALSIKPDYAEAYLNMGNALKDLGNLEEAIEAYAKSHSIKPDYVEVHYNMGIALQKQGKLDQAVEAYNKALSIKPDYAEVHYNIGIALQKQGKLDQAADAFSKALSIKPDIAEAHYNMGIALQEQSKLDEAIEAYKKAISIKPDYADAYNNMGNALQEQGKLNETIEAFNKALSIKPDYAEAFYNIGLALKGIIFSKPNRNLQKTIVSLLDRETHIRPNDIAKAAISLLKFEPTLQKHLQLADSLVIEKPLDVISDLSNLPLLLKLMNVCPLPDLLLEKLLTNLRCYILSNISSLKEESEDLLGFQSSLALQCFTNEYIYNHTEEEKKTLLSLEKKVKDSFKNNEQPNQQELLALASYKPLNQYDWCALLAVKDNIKEVFTRQVEEPNHEEKLKKQIPALVEIADNVSSQVRAQYEESPYPRWVNLGVPLKPLTISNLVDQIKLKLHENSITFIEKPDILIAGCGTGQHSIGTAKRFKSSKILAIDLSLSSLAYAKRKTSELSIDNIEYIQADILDLGQLNKQFDIIESAGVLHHMNNPMAGWKVLTDCLRPGGLMKIGLYSELARHNIVRIREEISQQDIGSSDIEMKSFRDMIVRSDKDHHKQILAFSDFYSVSELRDLLFHVQEHRFTIPQLKECLGKLRLKFCGFESQQIVSNFKQTNNAKEDLYDLDKWQAYEEANPWVFASMYQFWCQKVDY